MAGWIKVPLGMEVGLGPGDIVLDRVLDGSRCYLARRYRHRPRPHCVRSGPNSPPERGTAASPLFGPCPLWPNGRPSQILLSTC